MAGKKWRFWPKSAIFFPVNNFPAIIKKTRLLSFLGFWGYGYTNCATKGSIFEKSETKVKDKVIIF